MSYIRLKGSVRQVCDKMLIMELNQESKDKLQDVLDKLPETTNVRTIHCSGSFAVKLTSKTKIISQKNKWNNMSDLVGYYVDVTAMYKYYKFVSDDITTDGYTFIATIVRL